MEEKVWKHFNQSQLESKSLQIKAAEEAEGSIGPSKQSEKSCSLQKSRSLSQS